MHGNFFKCYGLDCNVKIHATGGEVAIPAFAGGDHADQLGKIEMEFISQGQAGLEGGFR